MFIINRIWKKLKKLKWNTPYGEYVSLSLEEMQNLKKGNCTDFTHFACAKASEKDLKKWGVCFVFYSESGEIAKFHCLPLIKYKNKYFVLENAWTGRNGIFEYESFEDAILENFELWTSLNQNSHYECYSYEASDIEFESLNKDQFLIKMVSEGEFLYAKDFD